MLRSPRASRCLAAIAALSALLGRPSGSAADPLTLERIFAAPDLSGPSLRAAQISPDGRYVTWLQGTEDNKDRLDLWAHDIRAGKRLRLVDSTLLGPRDAPLAPEEAQRRERQRSSSLSGILEYAFAPDGRSILVPLGGDLWLYDLARGTARALVQTAAYETDAKFSPRGRYVSYVRDANLYVFDLASGRERALTHSGEGAVSFGVAEFIAQEEMDRNTGYWWSPDERRIAFTRVDESAVAQIERFEIDARETRLVQQRYPASGARNARVELYVATLALEEPVRIDLGPDPDIYLARVDWFPDGGSLAVQRQSRDQRRLDLLKADATSGRTRTLLTETSATWVELHRELTFLERAPRFVWASRRSGHQHLYLYDLDGRLIRPLTRGEWTLTPDADGRAVRGLDENKGQIYFLANERTPIERHLYAVALGDRAGPGASLERLTHSAGWHSIVMSRDARLWLETFSTPDQPPVVTLRDPHGRALASLVANRLDAQHPYYPYLGMHRPTEFGTLAARDGQALHFQLIRPREASPGQRFPVIVDIYGGPHAQRVRRAWGGHPRSNEGFFRQFLAQRGYVVFTLDNRGSGFRGVAFESALHGRMGHVEVEDQLRGVEYLRSLPGVDPERIGIFGWSYGGYMSLMAAMSASDAYAAAVAGAPVTDWALYDTHYTERYLLTPQANPEGYAASSVLTHADGLRIPLLVVHGMADDNVLFTHSTALFARLQQLGKPFEIMVYPGGKHGLLRHADSGPHAYAVIADFFDRRLRQAR